MPSELISPGFHNTNASGFSPASPVTPSQEPVRALLFCFFNSNLSQHTWILSFLNLHDSRAFKYSLSADYFQLLSLEQNIHLLLRHIHLLLQTPQKRYMFSHFPNLLCGPRHCLSSGHSVESRMDQEAHYLPRNCYRQNIFSSNKYLL